MSSSNDWNRGQYDHFGKPLSEVFARDQGIIETARRKEESVSSIVSASSRTGSLARQDFLVMASNIFVATEEVEPVYLPAELALVRFSLQEGVREPGAVYHAFPQPGKIPLGYKHLALRASEKGHQIPLQGLSVMPGLQHKGGKEVEFRTKSDITICSELVTFLGEATEVFCPKKAAEQCRAVLDTIFKRAGLVPPRLSLLPLHVLLQQLAPSSVPSSGVAEVQLERERFRYTLGLLCPWHRAYTDTDSCSAATVRRQAYTVLDLACQQHGIQQKPGSHSPAEVQSFSATYTLPWDETEEKPVQEKKSWFQPRSQPEKSYTGLFGATDLRLREPAALHYPPRLREGLTSSGTISEYMADSRSQVLGGSHGVAESLASLDLGLGEGGEEQQKSDSGSYGASDLRLRVEREAHCQWDRKE